MVRDQLKREVLTVEDLADYLHCHLSTIYHLTNKGQIQGFRIEGGRLLRSDEFDHSATDRLKKPSSA